MTNRDFEQTTPADDLSDDEFASLGLPKIEIPNNIKQFDHRKSGSTNRLGRRYTDTPDTKIAVLENIATSHDKRLNDLEEFQHSVIDRLDVLIQQDNSAHLAIAQSLARNEEAIKSIAESMTRLAEKAVNANTLATKHEVIGVTILKVGSIFGVIVGGVYAIVELAIHYLTKMP